MHVAIVIRPDSAYLETLTSYNSYCNVAFSTTCNKRVEGRQESRLPTLLVLFIFATLEAPEQSARQKKR